MQKDDYIGTSEYALSQSKQLLDRILGWYNFLSENDQDELHTYFWVSVRDLDEKSKHRDTQKKRKLREALRKGVI